MQVDRAAVRLAVRATPRRPCPAAARCALSTSRTGGPPPPRRSASGRSREVQNQPAGPRAQQAAADQVGEQQPHGVLPGGSGVAEQRQVGLGQRQLGGGAAQVRARGRTGWPGRGRWPRPAGRTAPPGGAPGRCPAGRRGRRTRRARPGPARPARPACCQTDATVPGQPVSTTASRPGDVDAELEGVRGRDAEQVAASAAGAPARAAPPAGSRRGRPRPGRPARARPPRRAAPGRQRHRLGAAPGADERERAGALDDEVGEQVAGLGGGRAADRRAVLAAAGVLGHQRRLPERELGRRRAGEASSVTANTSQPGQPGRPTPPGRRTVAEASTKTGSAP